MTRQIMPSEYTWQASVCPGFLPELRHSPKSLQRTEVSGLAPVRIGRDCFEWRGEVKLECAQDIRALE
jgi:hypothetical protein